MEIHSKLHSKTRGTLDVVYRDVASYEELLRLGVTIHHIGAFAFYGNKLVIVYDKGKGMWMSPSGAVEIEKGESVTDATIKQLPSATEASSIRRGHFVSLSRTGHFYPILMATYRRSSSSILVFLGILTL